MPSKKRAIPPEAKALADAIEASGLSQAALAAHFDVTPSMVSQWATGTRPVAPEKAPQLGELLGVDPALISAKYRELREMGLAHGATGAPEPELQRLRREVLALNMAVGLLAGLTAQHRQAEAKAGAEAIRKTIPVELRESGLFRELLAVLERK